MIRQRINKTRQWTANRDIFDGVVLIDKHEGETSFDVVRKVKRVTALKKVGHTGTLDPFATGLLIILLGQATKLSPYLMAGKKRYLAVIRLGTETDTLDPTGRVIRTGPVPKHSKAEIEEIVLKFVGVIEQVPPIFSAISYRGTRAYKLAREGINPELKKRTVTVHSVKIISIHMPEITMDISCSQGTYIRSLASDIGKQMGSVAYLGSLRRLSSGPFQVEDALPSRQIDSSISGCDLTDRIIPLNSTLPHIVESQVDPETAGKIRNGYRPGWSEITHKRVLPDIFEGFIKIMQGTSLIAVAEVCRLSDRNKDWLKKMRVFH